MSSRTRKAAGSRTRLTSLLIGGLLACLVLVAPTAQAQLSTGALAQGAVGFGLWYGIGTIQFDAPATSATSEVRGYTEALPSSAQGQGTALGISYGSWGLSIGISGGQVPINKNVDTTGDGTADKFVINGRLTNRTVTVLFQPVRGLYAGYGQEEGSVAFTQIDLATSHAETRKIAYSQNFYSFGVALGFDPQKRTLGPIVTAYAKIPAKRGDFSGVTTGLGFGVYF